MLLCGQLLVERDETDELRLNFGGVNRPGPCRWGSLFKLAEMLQWAVYIDQGGAGRGGGRARC